MGDQLGTTLGGIGNTALGVGQGALDVTLNTLLAAAAPSTWMQMQAQKAATAADQRQAGQESGLAFLQSPQGQALLGAPGGQELIRQLFPQAPIPSAIPMEKLPPIPPGLPTIAAPSAPGDPTTAAYVLPPPPSELAASSIAQTLEATRRQLPVDKYGPANAQAQVGKDGKPTVQVQAGERPDTEVLLTEEQVRAIGDLNAQGLKAQTTRQVNAEGQPLYMLTRDKVAEAANIAEAKAAAEQPFALERIQESGAVSRQNAQFSSGLPSRTTPAKPPKAKDKIDRIKVMLMRKALTGTLSPAEQDLYDRLVRKPGSSPWDLVGGAGIPPSGNTVRPAP